jgi:hypothetical protein
MWKAHGMDTSIPTLFNHHQSEELKTAALDAPDLGAKAMRSKINDRTLGRVLSLGANGVASWS